MVTVRHNRVSNASTVEHLTPPHTWDGDADGGYGVPVQDVADAERVDKDHAAGDHVDGDEGQGAA